MQNGDEDNQFIGLWKHQGDIDRKCPAQCLAHGEYLVDDFGIRILVSVFGGNTINGFPYESCVGALIGPVLGAGYDRA